MLPHVLVASQNGRVCSVEVLVVGLVGGDLVLFEDDEANAECAPLLVVVEHLLVRARLRWRRSFTSGVD